MTKRVRGLAFATALGVCLVAPSGPAPAHSPSAQAAPRIRLVETGNSEGFAVPGFDGKILQHLTVYSDDLKTPRVRLELSGRVQAVMIPDPPMVAMRTVYKAGVALPIQLPSKKVKPTPGHFFSAINAESDSPLFRPTVAHAPCGTMAIVVTTEVDPAIPKGEPKDAYVRIHTTHPKKPEPTIPVSGAVFAATSVETLVKSGK